MADETSEGAAPAQAPAPSAAPAPPPSVSAERAAAAAGDFGAFDRVHVATRQGKSVPAVPAPSASRVEDEAADPAPTDDRPLSSRQRKEFERQQQINQYERRIAEQEQRLRALEASRAQQPATASNGQQPAAPAPETQKQRVARYLALPDAPKIDDFDTYPEYTAAQTLFLREQLDQEAQVVQQRHAAQQERHQALVARDQSFRERLTEAKEADPAFVEGLSQEARELGGIDHALRLQAAGRGPGPGPVNIIGELVYDSPQAVAFLKHLSAHPDALRALVTPPPALQRLPPPRSQEEQRQRVQIHIDHMVTEFRRLEGRLAYEASLAGASDTAPRAFPSSQTSVSAAPPPPPTLGKAGRSTDPIRAALARGDFDTFDQAETARLLAKRQGRAS